MARIKICFLWHMHQPFYRHLETGQYRLPWVRMHALKDYYGMVRILEEFPAIRQTFNLVPSLVEQLDEYASGRAVEPYWQLALKQAELLTHDEKELLLHISFRANEERMIERYPRYAELWDKARHASQIPGQTTAEFTSGMLRDLQVLSQLAWFDEEYLANDPDVRALCEKQREFTLDDQATLGRKQQELLGKVLNTYRNAAERKQIEISTSAFFHPILPLLCDSNIADVSHPYVALPPRFRYPEDASTQITQAKTFIEDKFGFAVNGMWPPEGAVSDEVLSRFAQAGIRWTATDDTVLKQTLGHDLSGAETYQPYLWKNRSEQVNVLFRDHRLSERIAVSYPRMAPEEAADHFIREVHKGCDQMLESGRDATVTIVLDGENVWEQYLENGRPFLRALYSRITSDAKLEAVTIAEALADAEPASLDHIFPGSWIEGNFDIWIGSEEDNRAWELLLEARRRLEEASRNRAADTALDLVRRELSIAEGSDWFWWYGPEHSAEGRAEFDALFRDHLAHVYKLLGEQIPAKLSHTLLNPQLPQHRGPGGMIQPTIDGKQTSLTEWLTAGVYRGDHTSGPLHSLRPPIRELRYGTDGQNLFLWLGVGDASHRMDRVELNVEIRNSAHEQFSIRIANGSAGLAVDTGLPQGAVQAALEDAFEIRVSLAALRAKLGSQMSVRVEAFNEGLPIGALPVYGELELKQTAVAAYSF